MNTTNLKLELIENICSTNDINLLSKIKDFFESENKKQKVYHFTEEQLSSINESIEQYKNGDFLTEEEAEEDIQKWFKEEDEK